MTEISNTDGTGIDADAVPVVEDETVIQESAEVTVDEPVQAEVSAPKEESTESAESVEAGEPEAIAPVVENSEEDAAAPQVSAAPDAPVVAEIPKTPEPPVIPTSENELKRAINKLRQDIDHHDNLIRKAIREAKHHRANVAELKAKRDEINANVRKSASEASVVRKERDEINASINKMKEERDALRSDVSKLAESIRQLKTHRDELNKDARGSTLGLRRFYVLDVETLLNADIPLKHEINLFDGIVDMHGRIDFSHKADDVHGEVTATYKGLNELSKKSDGVHRHIQQVAKESQAKHEVMVEMYRVIDKLRKEANDYHRQVVELYAVIKPLSESIDANKVTIKKLRAELAGYIDKMDDIHKDKVKGKQDKDRVVAKEKFKKTGKMNLDDLRLLLEGNELKL